MGTVIRFPVERRMAASADAQPFTGSATIIILPVVRTERHVDTASLLASGPALLSNSRRPTRRRVAVQPAP
jgi:hypothetical protein